MLAISSLVTGLVAVKARQTAIAGIMTFIVTYVALNGLLLRYISFFGLFSLCLLKLILLNSRLLGWDLHRTFAFFKDILSRWISIVFFRISLFGRVWIAAATIFVPWLATSTTRYCAFAEMMPFGPANIAIYLSLFLILLFRSGLLFFLNIQIRV